MKNILIGGHATSSIPLSLFNSTPLSRLIFPLLNLLYERHTKSLFIIKINHWLRNKSFNCVILIDIFTLTCLSRTLTGKFQITCPDKNGRYPTSQCDAYVECVNGVGEYKLCPDGLLFNANGSHFNYPCGYPIDVDCQGRAALRE